MALLSPSLAICSLGIACQTATRIEQSRELINELTGANTEQHRTPFDWLICPVSAAARMIRERRFGPADMAELTTPKRFWNEMGCYYWHHKYRPEQFAGWHTAVTTNWQRIAESERKVFVLSNTQNNIKAAILERGLEQIDTRVHLHDVLNLFEGLRGWFDNPELHVVTFDNAAHLNALIQVAGGSKIRVHKFTPDKSQWEGDESEWQTFFREILKGEAKCRPMSK